jgi:hypothetical protein
MPPQEAKLCYPTRNFQMTSKWMLGVILLFGFGLRVTLLKNNPMFVDELYEATGPISHSVMDNLIHFRLDATLLHVLLTMPMALAGWEPFLLRWTSFLAGMLSIPLCYQLGRQLFNNSVGILASAMLSVLPTAIITSMMIRGYSFMIPLSLMSGIFLVQALRRGDIHLWLLFAAGIILLIYTHAFAVIILAPMALYAACWIRRAPAQNRGKLLRDAALALAVIGIATAGIIALTLQSDQQLENALQFTNENWKGDFPPIQLSNLPAVVASYLKPLRRANFTGSGDWPQWYYGLLILVGGMAGIMEKRHRPGTWYLLLLVVVPLMSVALIATGLQYKVFNRYLDFALFGYVFLAAYGIWWFSTKVGRNRWSLKLGIGLLATMGIMWPAYGELAERYSLGESQQLVSAAHYLQQHASPADLIFCVARDDRRIDEDRRITVELEECLLTLHFYPELAGRTFSWQEMNFLTWQNLVMPEHKAVSHYIHLPHPGLAVSYEDGEEDGPQVWLVFWQRLASATPFIGDSSLVEAQFGNTRLVRISQGDTLSANLEKAGELILSDRDVSVERATRNTLGMAHLYASMADIPRVQALLDTGRSWLESLNSTARKDAVDKAEALIPYLPYLGGAAWPETGSQATWGDQIRLRGYTLRSNPVGETGYDITVTLFWQAKSPLRKDYSFFLHWRDEHNVTLAQVDFLPYDGRLPFQIWLPGEIIRETRTLHVPIVPPNETHRLVVGIYDPENGERLPLENDSSNENVLELAKSSTP